MAAILTELGRRLHFYLPGGKHPVEQVIEGLPPQPIGKVEDPLGFYPGKREHDAAWERSIESEEALALQHNIDNAWLRLTNFRERNAPLVQKSDVARLASERAGEVFNVSGLGFIQRKKKTNRREKRMQHRRRSIFGQMRSLERALQESQAAMEVFHEEWALAGDENRALFYAVEHLRDHEQEREDLFVRFVERHEQSPKQLGILFFHFADLLRVAEPHFFAQTLSSSPDLYFDRAEAVWRNRHPENASASTTQPAPHFAEKKRRRVVHRPKERGLRPLPYPFRWVVAAEGPLFPIRRMRNANTAVSTLKQTRPELMEILGSNLKGFDVFICCHKLTQKEMQHAKPVEEEGFFHGWQRVRRGRQGQYDYLFHKEDDGTIVFHLRRLPEEKT